MYVLALSDYKQLAAAAGYKPAPQLGRYIFVYPHYSLQTPKSDCASHFDLALMEINVKTKCEAQSLL